MMLHDVSAGAHANSFLVLFHYYSFIHLLFYLNICLIHFELLVFDISGFITFFVNQQSLLTDRLTTNPRLIE